MSLSVRGLNSIPFSQIFKENAHQITNLSDCRTFQSRMASFAKPHVPQTRHAPPSDILITQGKLLKENYILLLSANFRGKMIQCYHQKCDNVTNMLTDQNLKFLGKTADTITSTLHTLSEATGKELPWWTRGGFRGSRVDGMWMGLGWGSVEPPFDSKFHFHGKFWIDSVGFLGVQVSIPFAQNFYFHWKFWTI